MGQWLLRALHSNRELLQARYGAVMAVVGLANARDGFIHDEDGLDIPGLLGLVSERRSIAELPEARRWPTALAGLRATEADVLVEVTGSPSADGEPGLAHIREALGRGIPVATSNKWPVALHGVELADLARRHSVELRAESTVMSGTPILGPLVEGLAGATPIALRGILNATVNFILCRMADRRSYQEALAEAQELGLAERDPTADVEGQDSVAKLMILAALVFGRQLRPEEIACRGITDIAPADIDQAVAGDAQLRHVASLEFAEPGGVGDVRARVEPTLLSRDDPLAGVQGTTNAIALQASPLGEVTITGPGAGPELAGQGVLSDLIALSTRPSSLASA